MRNNTVNISQNIVLILERFKSSLKIKSDTKLAEYLQIKQNTISNWKKRNSLDYALLIEKCKEERIDLNYVFIDNNLEFTEEENNRTKILKIKIDIDSLKHEIEALKTLIKIEEELKDKEG